jgi:RNA polymerase sigma-70 factor (ECF subfamily)
MASSVVQMTQEIGLAERAAAGDRGAFRELVELHKERVFRIALGLTRNHHDAEDLVQDVFIRAYASLQRFRGDARLGSWLYRITVNAARDQHRRGVARRRHLTGSIEQPGLELVADGPDGDPERLAASRRIRRDIDEAVLGLTESERTIFILRHDGHLTLREIAETLGRAEGTVKNLLHRAVHKLRRRLAHYLETDSRQGGAV